MNFVHGLCVLSVTTVLFPRVAKMVAEGDVKAFKASLTEALSMVNFLVVPATVGTVVFSEEIVRFLFARGAFTEEATLQTGEALLFYSFGMLALGARDVFMRCLFALKDSKTPMTNTMAGVVVNVILSILLSRPLGVAGIALATSIASMVTALRMFVTLRRRIGPFGFRELLRSLSRVLLASILMGCGAKVSFILLRSKLMERMALSLAICAGVLAYIIFAMMFHVPEIERTMKVVKRKLVAILGRESVQTH